MSEGLRGWCSWVAWSGMCWGSWDWVPRIQLWQNHGLFFQFPVDFFLSVHFLWKGALHLLQESSWSLGWKAAGLSWVLQWLQVEVADCLILSLINSISSLFRFVCLRARGSRKCFVSQTGEQVPQVRRAEPWTCTVHDV